MSETKWTPGPWRAFESNVMADNGCIALCDTDNDTQERYEANARIMAAAPMLYQSIEKALRALHRFPSGPHDVFQAEAILEAALALVEKRGEQP